MKHAQKPGIPTTLKRKTPPTLTAGGAFPFSTATTTADQINPN
jgi:hypothetical protein